MKRKDTLLHERTPREQSGRDSFSRYKAQIRSAAIASLSILEGQETDRVYCDLHDDFVVRKKDSHGFTYIFYQVKTQGKSNHNWTLREIFGLKTTIKDQSKQKTDVIKDSFVGKMLIHTVVFGDTCAGVVFQTNIHNHDNVLDLIKDVETGKFSDKYSKVLIDRFNDCYENELSQKLTEEKIKQNISKLQFETDVQYIKDKNHNFDSLARDKIYEFSEVDLSRDELKEILLKLLDLVERKTSGKIKDLTEETIEKYAGISIEDLLTVLSLSKGAYKYLIDGGDSNAVKTVSIIQRLLVKAEAAPEQIEYCSRCKTDWDNWLREKRHFVSELHLNVIAPKFCNCLLLPKT